MAHNFRLPVVSNGLYISKAGNDSNAGTTSDAPQLSLNQLASGTRSALAVTSVIGTGAYKWPGATSGKVGRVVADGTVKVLGDGSTRMVLAPADTVWVDVYFDQFAGITFRSNAYDNNVAYERCIIKVLAQFAGVVNSAIVAADATYQCLFTDCILFNVNMANANFAKFTRCLFFNCTMGNVALLDSCYLDPTTSITTSTTAVTNNNIDPAATVGMGYGLNINGAGFSLVSPAGISVLPGFNSAVKEDYTLRAGSSHILRGIGPAQYRYANSYYAEFTGSANETASQANTHLRATGTNAVVPLLTITDDVQAFEVNNQGGMVLQSSPNSLGFGSFTTGRVAFADIADEMTVMLLKAGLNFDTAYPVQENLFDFNQPEIYNNNVPDWSNYAPGNAGRNPNRLTYRMRWSIKSNPNADLNNVNDWITGLRFVEFEWNQKPLWNPVTGLGNGDPGFDPAAAQAIQCTFYQLQVMLRNNYYH